MTCQSYRANLPCEDYQKNINFDNIFTSTEVFMRGKYEVNHGYFSMQFFPD